MLHIAGTYQAAGSQYEATNAVGGASTLCIGVDGGRAIGLSCSTAETSPVQLNQRHVPPTRTSASGWSRNTCVRRAKAVGSQTSSLSRNVTNSPRASAMPRLREALIPRLTWSGWST